MCCTQRYCVERERERLLLYNGEQKIHDKLIIWDVINVGCRGVDKILAFVLGRVIYFERPWGAGAVEEGANAVHRRGGM